MMIYNLTQIEQFFFELKFKLVLLRHIHNIARQQLYKHLVN